MSVPARSFYMGPILTVDCAQICVIFFRLFPTQHVCECVEGVRHTTYVSRVDIFFYAKGVWNDGGGSMGVTMARCMLRQHGACRDSTGHVETRTTEGTKHV